jgi:hypothetical protein
MRRSLLLLGALAAVIAGSGFAVAGGGLGATTASRAARPSTASRAARPSTASRAARPSTGLQAALASERRVLLSSLSRTPAVMRAVPDLNAPLHGETCPVATSSVCGAKWCSEYVQATARATAVSPRCATTRRAYAEPVSSAVATPVLTPGG